MAEVLLSNFSEFWVAAHTWESTGIPPLSLCYMKQLYPLLLGWNRDTSSLMKHWYPHTPLDETGIPPSPCWMEHGYCVYCGRTTWDLVSRTLNSTPDHLCGRTRNGIRCTNKARKYWNCYPLVLWEETGGVIHEHPCTLCFKGSITPFCKILADPITHFIITISSDLVLRLISQFISIKFWWILEVFLNLYEFTRWL